MEKLTSTTREPVSNAHDFLEEGVTVVIGMGVVVIQDLESEIETTATDPTKVWVVTGLAAVVSAL
jgi:hypothetical protein